MGSIALISVNGFCITNYKPGFIRTLVSQGVKVHAVAVYDEKAREAVRALGAEPVDLRMEPWGVNPFRGVLEIARLARILARLRPDATFSFFTKPLIYGSIAARLARVPRRFAMVSGLGFVFTSDGLKQRWLRPIMRALYRLSLRSCEQVFFENDEDLAFFRQARLIGAGKGFRVFGSGVDVERFSPQPLPDRPTFIYTGRMLREKGVVEFVEAARMVKAQHSAAQFTVVGGLSQNPGSLSREEMERLTSDDAVIWIDYVQDVRPQLAASSVFVLASYREGLPTSTLEAMAMARPVVTTDVTGCRETVETGVNGFLVPPRDPAALAGAMEAFIADRTLASRMGGESRRIVERKFDQRKVNAVLATAIAG